MESRSLGTPEKEGGLGAVGEGFSGDYALGVLSTTWGKTKGVPASWGWKKESGSFVEKRGIPYDTSGGMLV